MPINTGEKNPLPEETRCLSQQNISICLYKSDDQPKNSNQSLLDYIRL
jgi:hypothetical protein